MNLAVQDIQQELIRVNEITELCMSETGEIDEQLILDMIEGETNLHELILKIEDNIAEHDMNAEAVSLRIAKLQDRKARFKRSSETLRTIILSAMDKAGIRKIQGEGATITVKVKPTALIVNEESVLPSNYFKTETKLDKKKLLSALKEGSEIEGAELDNGGISLQIRRD
jgi:hypothetical protein